MLSKEQVISSNRALKVGFAGIVDVDAAAFEVFFGLAFGLTEAGGGKEFDEAGFNLGAREGFGRDFADDVVEGGFGDVGEVAAEEDFAGAEGFGSGLGAMDEVGHRFGEGFVGGAGFRFF